MIYNKRHTISSLSWQNLITLVHVIVVSQKSWWLIKRQQLNPANIMPTVDLGDLQNSAHIYLMQSQEWQGWLISPVERHCQALLLTFFYGGGDYCADQNLNTLKYLDQSSVISPLVSLHVYHFHERSSRYSPASHSISVKAYCCQENLACCDVASPLISLNDGCPRKNLRRCGVACPAIVLDATCSQKNLSHGCAASPSNASCLLCILYL